MQARYHEARPYFQCSVELARKHDDGSAELAINLENLGELEQLDGDAGRARELFVEAHALRLRRLGDQHPDTARSLIELGRLELDAGRGEAAREGWPCIGISSAKLGWASRRRSRYSVSASRCAS